MVFTGIDFIGFYGVKKVANDHITKKRPVIMFEVDFCTEDGGTIFIDDYAYPLKKNTIVCAKPGQKRYTKGLLRCYYAHFEIFNDELFEILTKLPNVFLIENDDKYKSLFIELCKYFNKNSDDSKIMLEGLILQLIYRLKVDAVDTHIFKDQQSAKAETVKKVVNYVKGHLDEDLSLKTLSKKFSFSPTYFHNSFKSVMNKTLREFVEERRIKKSIDLLLTTSNSIEQIAFICGFSSQSYFGYAFKRYTGTTPKKYVEDYFKKQEKDASD